MQFKNILALLSQVVHYLFPPDSAQLKWLVCSWRFKYTSSGRNYATGTLVAWLKGVPPISDAVISLKWFQKSETALKICHVFKET